VVRVVAPGGEAAPAPAVEPRPFPMVPLVASLGLGLAPFTPVPHLVEKLTWLVTGHPFKPIDVFDLVLHGAPWVWLAVSLVRWVRARG